MTAAVAAGPATAGNAYEILAISQELDFINLMAYDLYGGWDRVTGHQTDTGEDVNRLTVITAVDFWLASGMDPDKLVLGLATYGRSFQLVEKCDNNLLAPARGAGGAGRYTGERGFMAYYEICKRPWVSKVCGEKSEARAPYGTTDDGVWVGFDDEQSVAYKVVNVALHKNLGGIMFWALDLDDFTGYCGGGKYPIIKAANKALSEGIVPESNCKEVSTCGKVTTTTTTSSTAIASTTTTTAKSSTTPTTVPSTTKSTNTPQTVTETTRATATTPETTTETNKCRLPIFGNRKNCFSNPSGPLSTLQKVGRYCRLKCANDVGCCSQLCCCEEQSPTMTPTTTTNDPTTTTDDSTTTTDDPTTATNNPTTMTDILSTENPTSCEVPAVEERSSCQINKEGPFSGTPGIENWCVKSCPTDPQCTVDHCCCKRK